MSTAPVDVDPGFGARIAAAAGPGVTVREVAVMPGGHSGLTHRVTLDGLPGHDVVIVKSTPPGRRARGRHDVLRQARMITALVPVDGVPTAEICFMDPEPPPFFASSCAAGEAVDPVIPEDYGERPTDLVAGRWDVATKILAALHAVEPAAIGFEREPARTPEAELELWCETMVAARMDDDPQFVRLRDAMRATLPRAGVTAIVHGDFRLGNVLFDGPRATALIDWEIWAIGDPLVDLAWFVQFTDPDNFPGIGRDAPGTPSAAEVVAHYHELTGAEVRDPEWFLALGCLKLAAIQAHNRRRHLDGRFHDPFQALLGPSIERHLRRGIDIIGA
jgi:aminoglycoside phosphotransferase (APT) family kinase protein